MSLRQDEVESENTPVTTQQTLSQRRANFAIARVREIRDRSFASEFRSYAASLPAMIQMNGFGQAMAFIRSKKGTSKKDSAYGALYQLVSDWLVKPDQPYASHGDVLDGVTKEGMSRYRLAQTEALALLDWVKRFATAFIEGKNDGDDTPARAEV